VESEGKNPVMEKRYRLLFIGVAGDEGHFRAELQAKGVQDRLIDQMFELAPVIIKQGLSLAQARHYADMLRAMGAKITILDDQGAPRARQSKDAPLVTPMSEFVPCPQCGLVQPEGSVCYRCGADLSSCSRNGGQRVAGH